MLKTEITQQADSVEELFCKPFDKLKRHPMPLELTKLAMSIILSDINVPEAKKPFLFKIIEKRLEHCFTFKIKDQKLLLFLCALTETPGSAVMYLTYLQYWCKQNNKKEVDMQMFCERIFPMGFPLRKEIHKLWDETKVERKDSMASDNLLDYQTALSSIQH